MWPPFFKLRKKHKKGAQTKSKQSGIVCCAIYHEELGIEDDSIGIKMITSIEACLFAFTVQATMALTVIRFWRTYFDLSDLKLKLELTWKQHITHVETS